MYIEVNNVQKEEVINNVIGTIYGSVEPGELRGGDRGQCSSDHHHLSHTHPHSSLDKLVLLGNHRDAWVFGAADPNSGTAALMEIARGLAQLRKQGEEEEEEEGRSGD